MGQGVNAVLLDVGCLAATLAQHPEDTREALLAYERARLPEMRALMQIMQVCSSVPLQCFRLLSP